MTLSLNLHYVWSNNEWQFSKHFHVSSSRILPSCTNNIYFQFYSYKYPFSNISTAWKICLFVFFFAVLFFTYFVWKRENIDHEELYIWTLFTQCSEAASSLEVFYRKSIPKNLANFTEKHLYQSLFFDLIKLQTWGKTWKM